MLAAVIAAYLLGVLTPFVYLFAVSAPREPSTPSHPLGPGRTHQLRCGEWGGTGPRQYGDPLRLCHLPIGHRGPHAVGTYDPHHPLVCGKMCGCVLGNGHGGDCQPPTDAPPEEFRFPPEGGRR